MTKLMKCLACEDVRPMTEGAFTCACGRSAAVVEGPVVELQGPARILVPADVETVDGVPWTTLPEEPVVIRRRVVSPVAA